MLDKHCTSLELSKRLKALGVKQESQYYWVSDDNIEPILVHRDEPLYQWTSDGEYGGITPSALDLTYLDKSKELADDIEIYSAFLASELGEMMKSKGMGVVAYSSIQGKWWCSGGKWDVGKQAYDGLEQSDTMQDALALMLEYLIQNKLITI